MTAPCIGCGADGRHDNGLCNACVERMAAAMGHPDGCACDGCRTWGRVKLARRNGR